MSEVLRTYQHGDVWLSEVSAGNGESTSRTATPAEIKAAKNAPPVVDPSEPGARTYEHEGAWLTEVLIDEKSQRGAKSSISRPATDEEIAAAKKAARKAAKADTL